MSRRSRETLWRTQNFLRDPRLIERLVAIARVTQRDVVYDLGAGRGALTASLARHAGRVIAIEMDEAVAAQLRRRLRDRPNVVVREADILTHRLPQSEYLVFANPPFDITAELVRRLTSADVPPRDAYLVLQREAAQRFIGRPRMTLAALLIAPWFSLNVLHSFHRSDFSPAPSVDAVFVRLHKRGPPLVAESEAQLCRVASVHRRGAGARCRLPRCGTADGGFASPVRSQAIGAPSLVVAEALRPFRDFARCRSPAHRGIRGATVAAAATDDQDASHACSS